MSQLLLVAGGGIAGLATALAATRAGWHAHVFEQASAFSEVGAGLQLGPNATRVLRGWGLLERVAERAVAPHRLVARDAQRGHELAALPLGQAFEQRYGAPYLVLHRADLHTVLLDAARTGEVHLHTAVRVQGFDELPDGVSLRTGAEVQPEGDALVGADGLWSQLREQLLQDGPPRPSDHVAWRGLVPMARVPAPARRPEVTAWLAPRMHAVTYPVWGGEALNIVCVVQEHMAGDPTGWDHPGAGERLRSALGPVCTALRELVEAVPAWGLWVLHDRQPVGSAAGMARGRVALAGDAAHPMRPYLAQGAAMALEDACELGKLLSVADGRVIDVPLALQRYGLNRWERAARVQRRSLRNAGIFHAGGALRIARNAALRSAGARLMDVPWLYAG